MIVLLLLLLTLAPPQPKIVTCRIGSYTSTVFCPRGVLGSPNQVIPEGWREEWELIAPLRDGLPNTDAPLGHKKLEVGQRVALHVDEEGKLTALPNCDVRVYRNIKKWREGGREGERLPNTLYTSQDEDCRSRQ